MTNETRSRARSMAELGEVLSALIQPEDIGASIGSYRPRPTDIVISPFAKCGTTWLQQTFHCLRTRGDMDFDDISRVVPWIETSRTVGLDIEAPQRAEPRGFKSHLSYDHVPKGARYVVAFRDPTDALLSAYRFSEGWFFEPGAVTIEEYAATWLDGKTTGSDYWSHLASWWNERDNPDVLVLSYEYMLAEPTATIRGLASFCGIPLDDDLLALAVEHSSFAFMKRHEDRFDDLLMRQASEARCNLPAGSDSSKVRKGGSGGGRLELPAKIAAALDAQWAERIAPTLGFADYAALETALRQRVP